MKVHVSFVDIYRCNNFYIKLWALEQSQHGRNLGSKIITWLPASTAIMYRVTREIKNNNIITENLVSHARKIKQAYVDQRDI